MIFEHTSVGNSAETVSGRVLGTHDAIYRHWVRHCRTSGNGVASQGVRCQIPRSRSIHHIQQSLTHGG